MIKLIAVAATALILIGCSRESERNQTRAKNDHSATQRKDTLIVTSVNQSSGGLTADDIGPEFVSVLEQHFVEQGKQHFQIAMKNMGYQGDSVEYEVGTALFDENGEKLAVTTLKTVGKNSSTTKIAWWISGGHIKRVACTDSAGNEVPIRFGACAAKIAEVFDYKHWALDSRLP